MQASSMEASKLLFLLVTWLTMATEAHGPPSGMTHPEACNAPSRLQNVDSMLASLRSLRGIVMYLCISPGMQDEDILTAWGRPNLIFGYGPGYHSWDYLGEGLSIDLDPDGKVTSRTWRMVR
jgi:hypothetical protein